MRERKRERGREKARKREIGGEGENSGRFRDLER